jgi:predicted amino acid-binding ACT domain protein
MFPEPRRNDIMSKEKVTDLQSALCVRSEDVAPYVTDSQLRDTIRKIDETSQHLCHRIFAMAAVAEAALQVLDDKRTRHLMINAAQGILGQIQDVAEELKNAINAAAEDVGCNHSERAST